MPIPPHTPSTQTGTTHTSTMQTGTPNTSTSHTFTGGCHCGAIGVTLNFTRPAEETQVRACQCGFCTRQGALTVSDPAGHCIIEIPAGHFSTYRFATQSATSLICGNCGTYTGILLQEGPLMWSVANARGLAVKEFKNRAGVPMQYEHETMEARIARRKEKWTPSEIRFKV